MKRIFHLLAALLAAALVSCPNPASPPANNPPTARFPGSGLSRSAARSTAASTGTTSPDGDVNGYPSTCRMADPTSCSTSRRPSDSGLRHWGLHEQHNSSRYLVQSASPTTSTASLTPPGHRLGHGSGAGSCPPLVTQLPISGEHVVPDGMLTAQYIFTDPDGDAEGATTLPVVPVRRRRFHPGARRSQERTSASYTTVAGDNAKWLRIEVTPVDEYGAAGTTVLSDPIQVGSS